MLPEQPGGDSRRAAVRATSPAPLPARPIHCSGLRDDHYLGRRSPPTALALRARGRLAIPILRRVWPRDRLPHTTRAIASVRALARANMAAVNANTAYRLEAAIVELGVRADELEDHAEVIAVLLALLPSPDRRS